MSWSYHLFPPVSRVASGDLGEMGHGALEPYFNVIREGVLTPRGIREDIARGRCRPVLDRHHRLVGAKYQDGRRFDRIDDIFYTPEAFVTMFMLGYAMSSHESATPDPEKNFCANGSRNPKRRLSTYCGFRRPAKSR